MKKLKVKEAINDSLRLSLKKSEKVFILGEDVGIIGGLFGQTNNLINEFGPKRVIDTPISETAIVGAAIGAALVGLRPVAEIMYMDFTTCCMDMIVNQMAKIHYMFSGQFKIPMVVRMTTGASGSNAAQHSGSFYSFFVNTAGLIVVAPSNAYDAKGLLCRSIESDNPVIFLEHKRLLNTKGDVPEEYYTIPLGKADIKRSGNDITIAATQALVNDSLKVADEMEKEHGISIEVIDPRTLNPLDKETIFESIKKTGKLIVADEGCLNCGFAGHVSSVVAEEVFDYLDAPIIRVASPNTPVPYTPPLEEEYIIGEKEIKNAVNKLIKNK
ncbi:MAG: alpha-ketoacid dehydrogenase subunit beta [Candidatus Hodarchaeales archaeon]|jgi:pyruvate dehydrogenase E1 component beta subunit